MFEKIEWYLRSRWVKDQCLLETMEDQERSDALAETRHQRTQENFQRLEHRVTELESQLLALEAYLSELGVLPPQPEPEGPWTAPAGGAPVTFPCRTEELIACPVCGRRQRGNRDACYNCGTGFQYEV